MRCSCCAGCSSYAGEPVVLDEITLPAALFRGLTKARYDAYRGSMYSFFESQFGVRMLKAQEKIRAVAADAADGAHLGTEDGRAAAGGRSRDAHVRRPSGRSTPRPVRDARVSLPATNCTDGVRALLSTVCSRRACAAARYNWLRCCTKLRFRAHRSGVFSTVSTRILPTMAALDRPAVKPRPVYLNLFAIRLPLAGYRLDPAPDLRCAAVPDRHSACCCGSCSARSASPEAWAQMRATLAHPFAKLVLLVLAWAYFHHFMAGIRHLLMDLHIGMDLQVGAAIAARSTLVLARRC